MRLTTFRIQTFAFRHFLEANYSKIRINFKSSPFAMCACLFSHSWAITDLFTFFKCLIFGKLIYSVVLVTIKHCPVGWGCRIHWLPLCRGVRPPPPLNECPAYNTKQSDGEVPVKLELWGMQSTHSLPLLPGSLWPGGVAPDRALSMG